MKKLFTQPDIEILSFLCDAAPGVDSATKPGENEGAEGDSETILP